MAGPLYIFNSGLSHEPLFRGQDFVRISIYTTLPALAACQVPRSLAQTQPHGQNAQGQMQRRD
jgi:hypothetical protein